MFSQFASRLSNWLGNPIAFAGAILMIVGWLVMGPFFSFSDTWQLFINTTTTITTFLMVFLLQNTQNRDMIATQLKLDEIIRAMEGAHNELLKIELCSDAELKEHLTRYENLAQQVKSRIKKGHEDTGTPEL